MVDNIKAVKSEEEIELIKKTASLQDKAMDTALREVKPGVRNSEIMALVQYSVQKMGSEEIEYFVPLVGRFQAENALAAVAAAQTLGVPKDVIPGGIAETRLRGRMEIVSHNPLVIVDGAHNPPAAEATASEIVSLGLAPAVFVVGINRPKDYKNMLSIWARTAKAFVFTDLDNPRAYPPQVLADFAKGLGVAAQTIPDPAEALERAEQIAGPRGTVFVAGSLYLAGKMLQIFGSKSPA